MVWIYGGGLENGSSEEPLYDATAFVRGRAEDGQRVIVVSGNYRTGVLGWFAGEGVEAGTESEEEVGAGRGNYGLYDVATMFEWVRNNIERFGGNPENVTVCCLPVNACTAAGN